MTVQIKVCRCCGTKTFNPRKRVCDRCKVPAIWDAGTAEMVAEEEARRDRMNDLMERLLAGKDL